MLSVVLDDTRVYIEHGADPERNELIAVEKDGSSTVTLIPDFRAASDETPLFASDGLVFSQDGYFTIIQAHWLDDGEQRTLVTAEEMMPFLHIRSVSDGYLYYSESIDRADDQGKYIARVPVTGGEPERLQTQNAIGTGILAVDGYLYWDETARVLRKRL